MNLSRNTFALSSSITGTTKLIVFGPVAVIPVVGGVFLADAVGVVPARMSMMSNSGGAELVNNADGSAVICGMKDPRVVLGDARGRPRISSKSSDAVGGRSERGRFLFALVVALAMKDERGRWIPRAAVGGCQ